jgi:hypothetical protein
MPQRHCDVLLAQKLHRGNTGGAHVSMPVVEDGRNLSWVGAMYDEQGVSQCIIYFNVFVWEVELTRWCTAQTVLAHRGNGCVPDTHCGVDITACVVS